MLASRHLRFILGLVGLGLVCVLVSQWWVARAPELSPEEPEPPVELSLDDMLALDHEVWLRSELGEGLDPVADVAEEEGLGVELVEEALEVARRERRALERGLCPERFIDGSCPYGQLVDGISWHAAQVGEISVEHGVPGPLTVVVQVTIDGCPKRTDLARLVEPVMMQLVHNFPDGADGLEAEFVHQDCWGELVVDGTYDGVRVSYTVGR